MARAMLRPKVAKMYFTIEVEQLTNETVELMLYAGQTNWTRNAASSSARTSTARASA
jgi:hypothetical protein